jgi:protoheme ferro-lyase
LYFDFSRASNENVAALDVAMNPIFRVQIRQSLQKKPKKKKIKYKRIQKKSPLTNLATQTQSALQANSSKTVFFFNKKTQKTTSETCSGLT